MSGFNNPIVGGGGVLVYPAIHSKNFAHNVSGWTINADGSAEFDNLAIRGTFNGTNYVFNAAGEFRYSGTPAAGNLVYSDAQVAGTDGFGNKYLAGLTTYDNAASLALNINQTFLTWYTMSAQPGATFTSVTQLGAAFNHPGIGAIYGIGIQNLIGLRNLAGNNGTSLIQNNDLGILNYTTSNAAATADGNTYSVGRNVTRVGSTVHINSTAPAVILSANVAAATYRVKVMVAYVGLVNGGVPQIGWNGSSTVSNTVGQIFWSNSGGGSGSVNSQVINLNTAPALQSGPTLVNGGLFAYQFDGIVTFSGAGTFNIRGQEDVAGNAWDAAINSFLELIPL